MFGSMHLSTMLSLTCVIWQAVAAPAPAKSTPPCTQRAFQGRGYIDVSFAGPDYPAGCLTTSGRWTGNTKDCAVFSTQTQPSTTSGFRLTTSAGTCFFNDTASGSHALSCGNPKTLPTYFFHPYGQKFSDTIDNRTLYWYYSGEPKGRDESEFYVTGRPTNKVPINVDDKPIGQGYNGTNLFWRCL